jgi:hypothetical protein
MAESHCSIITADLQGIETETDRKSANCFRSCREVASNDGRVYCHHRHLLFLKSFSAERGHYK